MTTGKRIRGYRVMQGWTQEDFGSNMGVSVTTIKNWESDRISPRIDELLAMADLFGVEYTQLVGENKEVVA